MCVSLRVSDVSNPGFQGFHRDPAYTIDRGDLQSPRSKKKISDNLTILIKINRLIEGIVYINE